MALIQSTAIPSGATDYELEQSLRFNDDDSAYLSWTPSSAGNRTTWTWSGWIKSSATGTDQTIFTAEDGSDSSSTMLVLKDAGELQVWQNGNKPFFKTNAVYRDPSAWMHIVIAMDTTQSTSTNRFKMYVNGEQITSFSTSTYPDQNQEPYINAATRHDIGNKNYTGSNSEYLNGYLSEVNFIDGQALTPADFGETGDYGEWKPIEYEGTYGTNGFYLNFAGGGIMSATGGTITTDGDYKVHSFTSNGTFTPTTIANSGEVEYLVIGGGGGAGGNISGGGGAGGYRTGYLAVTKQAYTVTIGSGGSGGGINGVGAAGSNSVFSTITSTGGGAGGSYNGNAGNGGSGGGAGSGTAGTGTSGQGNNGGTGYYSGGSNHAGGGGGGAGAVGANGSSGAGGNGGAGVASSITGSSVTRAGGGAGLGSGSAGSGGSGGGGDATTTGNATGTAGTANTGGGGGGGTYGGAGGSGVVIIRYKFQ